MTAAPTETMSFANIIVGALCGCIADATAQGYVAHGTKRHVPIDVMISLSGSQPESPLPPATSTPPPNKKAAAAAAALRPNDPALSASAVTDLRKKSIEGDSEGLIDVTDGARAPAQRMSFMQMIAFIDQNRMGVNGVVTASVFAMVDPSTMLKRTGMVLGMFPTMFAFSHFVLRA